MCAVDADGGGKGAGRPFPACFEDVVAVLTGQLHKVDSGGAKPSQNSRAHSTSKSPTFSVGQRTDQLRVHRPDRSAAQRMRASSIGRWQLPYRQTPRISPSPRRKACPSAMPTSSAVWW